MAVVALLIQALCLGLGLVSLPSFLLPEERSSITKQAMPLLLTRLN